MADFRKWLYAFAVVALLAGLTVPAGAQTFQTCQGGAVNPIVRAEGYTELAGDITITCSNGTVTGAGLPIPAVTITVSMNTNITSKLTATTGFNPAFNEALLLIDEPGLQNPILNCGNAPAGAPYDPVAGAGVCADISTGTTAQAYNGTSGHPNVFQGRQVGSSLGTSIQFVGVPLDGGSHTLRITNLRANAVGISGGHVTGSSFGNANTFQSTVTFNSPNSVNAQVIQVTNGTLRNGLDSVTATPAPNSPFLQCTFTGANPTTINAGTVTLTEGFQSSWKTRNWSLIDQVLGGNGHFVGTPDWAWNGTNLWTGVDTVQNVPNSFYNTESGFMFPPPPVQVPVPNPPPGISNLATLSPPGNPFVSSGVDTGIAKAGVASQGTRFAVKFANIPAGTTLNVPLIVPLTNTTSGGVAQTGVMVQVSGTDANGAGGTVGTGTSSSTSDFTAIYEVLFADPLVTESAVIQATVTVAPFNGSNPQVGVTATAQAGFAPWYDNGAGSSAGTALLLGSPLSTTVGPIPRFITGFSPKVNLFSFTRCACDLLFPYIVSDANFSTGIVVANTSEDPSNSPNAVAGLGFTATQQAGTVTFWFFGTNDFSFTPTNYGAATDPSAVIAPITSLAVPAGSYTALVIATSTNASAAATLVAQTAANPNIKAISTAFTGYVIAQAQFQFCHGVASITSPSFSPQTYIGLVLDKGSQLPRTNQVFADSLEQ